jgi:hypothetical protein|tara:strand:+ start:555 stop:911 length:357 start_codon:yes stop_codon:yes gene_type:complete
MEVIRDTIWQECLTNAVTMYRLSEPDDRCYILADATWKMKMRYLKHQQKKDTQKIIVLEKPPELVNEQRTSKKICCAVTMSGKPCSFKAICGDYCRKHSVKNNSIGAKVDVSQIKIVD